MQLDPHDPVTLLNELEPALLASRLRLSEGDLARWLEQLATLLAAGLALPEALRGMEPIYTRGDWPRLFASLADELALGRGLHEAFALHPRTFSAFSVALIRTGERTGQLELALRRLAGTIEARVRMRRQLLQILAYPAVVMVVATGISVFMLWSVMPQFAAMFRDSGTKLPWLTEQMLLLSDGLREQWLAVLLTAALGVPLTVKLIGARAWQPILMHAPLIGPLWLQMASSRWATTLGLTTRVGLPFLEALELAASNAGHPRYLRVQADWAERVRRGDPLAQVLANSPLPSWALQMIGVGQDSGTLDRMLERIAAILDEDTERRVKQLQTLLEPCVMLILGGLVGTLLLAMYLPIFNLSAAVG